MKTIEEMIAVMQAFADGKKIEFYDDVTSEWIVCEKPYWNWDDFDYRIKTEPKYRPYLSVDECFADVQKHGGWVKDKKTGVLYLILEISPLSVDIHCHCVGIGGLLNDYVYPDGTPCGVLEE